jgi:biotin synthase-related radical SAM superfamily protein
MHHKGPRNTSTKWGVIHYPKSLWDLKNEINSLHFNDFIVISLCKHRVSLLFDIIHYYNLLW